MLLTCPCLVHPSLHFLHPFPPALRFPSPENVSLTTFRGTNCTTAVVFVIYRRWILVWPVLFTSHPVFPLVLWALRGNGVDGTNQVKISLRQTRQRGISLWGTDSCSPRSWTCWVEEFSSVTQLSHCDRLSGGAAVLVSLTLWRQSQMCERNEVVGRQCGKHCSTSKHLPLWRNK